jgi:DNA-binding response OmpR family regulator
MMPDMRGDEMLKKLRDTDWGKSVKVIILSNKSEQEASFAVRDLGVRAVIVKANMPPRQVADLVKKELDKQLSDKSKK